MIRAMLGVLCVGLAVSAAKANLVHAPGFEGLATIADGLPNAAGVWGGDEGNTVVGAQAALGIGPRAGDAMQQVIGLNTPNQAGSNNSDTVQLVDLAPYASAVAAGNAVAHAEAFFNRLGNDGEGAGKTNRFILSLRAHGGAIADYPAGAGSFLAARSPRLFADVDPATWEGVQASLDIPVGATYLALVITAEDAAAGLPGHFADDVSLVVVPEPATGAAFAGGALALLVGRRRRA